MDPPLSIPNREVKRNYADGTDPPVGRVGSCRSSKGPNVSRDARAFFRRSAACGCSNPQSASLPAPQGACPLHYVTRAAPARRIAPRFAARLTSRRSSLRRAPDGASLRSEGGLPVRPSFPQVVATLTCAGAPPNPSLSGRPESAFPHSATGRHADMPCSAAKSHLVRPTRPIWPGSPRQTAPEGPQRHFSPATTCGKPENNLVRPLAENA